MLVVDHLESGYKGKPVLQGVSFDLPAGASLALLGRNGVGKSTLLRTLIGHVTLKGGSIHLDGADISRRHAHERAAQGVAFVPQGREIFSGLTVGENLRVGAQAIFGRSYREHVERVYDYFPSLTAQHKVRGESLSGGQQQILALARALVGQPRILLLDEPSEGIAPAILEELATLLRRVRKERGLSILVAEQNVQFAGRITTSGLVLERGKVSAQVDLNHLLRSPDELRRLLAV